MKSTPTKHATAVAENLPKSEESDFEDAIPGHVNVDHDDDGPKHLYSDADDAEVVPEIQ